MSQTLIDILKKEIAGSVIDPKLEQFGTVTEVGDGIATITGLSGALSQEILTITTKSGAVDALAFSLQENSIGAVILGDDQKVRAGDEVRSTGRVLSVDCGPELIGRVIDPLGNPLDGKGAIFTNGSDKTYLLEKRAPGVLTRESVKVPLHTGTKSIDAMIPIGRGQRELIIGDRQTGKTTIAIDTILNQGKDAGLPGQGRPPVTCIYVAIGQKQSKIATIVETLRQAGALEYTVVVAASASSKASMQYLAPFAGCAIGEYFMDQGKDALIVYDDLSKHADSYRELSLLLRRPPGREAYPGDIFYLHSRLLERSARLNAEYGGGSLTALPIIETKLGDVSAYVPTNVISITDGQIYLEADLFYKGIRPAVNAGISVSRVGSSAQTKAMKKVASKLRLELAQFRELQAFSQFASDLDTHTQKQLQRGELLTEMLKQTDGEPKPFEEEVAIIFAATNGLLDGVAISEIRLFETNVINYLKKMAPTALETIKTTGELSDDTIKALTEAINRFKNDHR